MPGRFYLNVWVAAARGRCAALGNDRAVGSRAGAARRGRGDKDSLETSRFLGRGTTPPRTPSGPLAPPPPGRPSAHALSPRGVTWRFKSRRLARVGQQEAELGRAGR